MKPHPVRGWDRFRRAMMITRVAMFSEGRALLWAYTLLFVALAAALGSLVMFEAAILQSWLVPALPLTFLAMFYWDRFVIHAVKQNSPAGARLVPGQHAAVRLALMMAWLLALVPCIWLATGFRAASLIVLIFANYLTASALMRAGYTAGKVIYLALFLFAMRLHEMDAVVAYLMQAPVALALASATVAFAWLGLRMAVPKGGERHWGILPAQAKPVRVRDLPANWIAGPAFRKRHWLYGLQLGYDLRHDAKPEYLLLHAFGPNNHRFDLILPLAVMVSVVAGLWVAQGMQRGAADSGATFLLGMLVIPVITVQFYTLRRVVSSARATVAEQRLVRLAPRIAPAPSMWRVLAGQLLANSLREWCAIAVLVLVLVAISGASMKVVMVPASLMLCSLCASGWALRDYSTDTTEPRFKVLVQSMPVAAGGALHSWPRFPIHRCGAHWPW